MPATEAFPPLSPPSHERVASITNASSRSENGPTRRRRSSGLGGEIRAGDTSAPALATLDVIPQSPRSIKVR
jgi:acyl-CoA-dependent ceramide synthase